MQNEISQPKFLPLLHGVLSVLNLLLAPLQYYSEANEADSWMNEKAGLAASQDYGKDEDAATKYLKTHAVRVVCSVNSKLHIYQLRTYVRIYICMHICTYTVLHRSQLVLLFWLSRLCKYA